MKTLQEQYTKILKGDGRKDLFLKEAKHKYPNLISNITSFSDAEKILKSKSVINEELGGVVPYRGEQRAITRVQGATHCSGLRGSTEMGRRQARRLA